MFELFSGWTERERFGHNEGGYVTVETDVKTGAHEAFLWVAKTDMCDHEHLRCMFMGGNIFVKRFNQ